MSWVDGTLVAFDLETTGTDPETARIVTACVAKLDAKQRDVSTWLADPGIEIPAEATAVHGITNDHAREHGRPAKDVVREVAQALDMAWRFGLPVVIYNAPYDLTVLDREIRRHRVGEGHALPPQLGPIGPVVDPLLLDRVLDRWRSGSRKLIDVCRHYGVDLSTLDAHTAEADAVAAARLAWKLARAYGPLLDDLGHLQERQAAWFAAWAENFEQYLRVKGKPEVISRAWPIAPYVESAGAVA